MQCEGLGKDHTPDYGRFMIETIAVLGLTMLIGMIVTTSFPNVIVNTLALALLGAIGYFMGVVNSRWPYGVANERH